MPDESFGTEEAGPQGLDVLFYIFMLLGLAFTSAFCFGSFRNTPVFVYLIQRGYILPAVC